MTAKKIQPTNPNAATSETKDAKDTGGKTATAKSSHRTSGRKTSGISAKH